MRYILFMLIYTHFSDEEAQDQKTVQYNIANS